MAKKIRFALILENESAVRTMEEFRNNFSLLRVLEYIKNGKLVTWLRDRYENDLAEEIECLDILDLNLAQQVSEIFDIPFKTNEDRVDGL